MPQVVLSGPFVLGGIAQTATNNVAAPPTGSPVAVTFASPRNGTPTALPSVVPAGVTPVQSSLPPPSMEEMIKELMKIIATSKAGGEGSSI